MKQNKNEICFERTYVRKGVKLHPKPLRDKIERVAGATLSKIMHLSGRVITGQTDMWKVKWG